MSDSTARLAPISGAETPDLVERTSPLEFSATVARLTEAIEAAGLQIFATIDHAAAARGAGLQMPPTVVLLYGHAKGGTPIMQATPAAALDLPLRVLVRALPDGRTTVAFHPIVALLGRAGVAQADAQRLAPAQQLLLGALGA